MENGKPPLFPYWGLWYAAVVIWLGLLIGFFYLFTKTFS
jgi:hypothetical protein